MNSYKEIGYFGVDGSATIYLMMCFAMLSFIGFSGVVAAIQLRMTIENQLELDREIFRDASKILEKLHEVEKLNLRIRSLRNKLSLKEELLPEGLSLAEMHFQLDQIYDQQIKLQSSFERLRVIMPYKVLLPDGVGAQEMPRIYQSSMKERINGKLYSRVVFKFEEFWRANWSYQRLDLQGLN